MRNSAQWQVRPGIPAIAAVYAVLQQAAIQRQPLVPLPLLDNKGKLPAGNDPRYIFKEPKKIVSYKIDPETGFLSSSEEGLDEIFIDGNIPEASPDSLSYNFYPTAWGMHDATELY